MSRELHQKYKTVLIEDLKAFKNGLEAEDYAFCNIISNRLITNAVILKSDKHVLLGAILKELIYEYRRFKDDNNIKKATVKFTKLIESYISGEKTVELSVILDDYLEFYKDFLNIMERPMESYEYNINFTNLTVKFCLEFFKNELEENAIPINIDVITFGIINEIRRVMKSFGFDKKILMLRLVLTFFGRMYEFFRFLIVSETENTKWRDLYQSYRSKIIQNLKSYESGEEYLNESLVFLFELCQEWRYMFMRLLELPKATPIEKEVSIPENIKEELNKMVSNLIRKKLEEES